MAKIGTRSTRILADPNLNPTLSNIVHDALAAAPAALDFAVLSGYRTAEEQRELWAQGRRVRHTVGPVPISDPYSWEIADKSKVVTYKDGTEKLSRHQSGEAVDIVAWKGNRPDWDATRDVAAYVVGFAAALGIKLRGGYEWGWDAGHLELEEN